MRREARRPRLHFTASSGWINDPLGPVFRDGRYHLFFQYVPGATAWRPECWWGHATSEDLLTWTEHPPILRPDETDGGVWSGSIVAVDETAADIFYTSVSLHEPSAGRPRVAHATDSTWSSWRKGAFVAQPPPDVDLRAYRDPYVFRHDEAWHMIVGAGLRDGTATALHHTSADGRAWEYTGLLAARHTSETEPVWTGDVWECPQLFRVDDQWVLTVSAWQDDVTQHEAYALGTFDHGVFRPTSWGSPWLGPSYYASSNFVDSAGLPCVIHWLRGVADPDDLWTGSHSLPQVLSVREGRLVVEPHPGIAQLRSRLEPGASDTSSISLTSPCDIDWRPGAPGATLTAGAPDGAPEVSFEYVDETLIVRTGDHDLEMPCSDARARVILDGQVLEVFASGNALAAPLSRSCATVHIQTDGPGTFDAYELNPLDT